MYRLKPTLKQIFSLLIIPLLFSCNSSKSMEELIGATRFINHFDYDTYNYRLTSSIIGESDETGVKTSFDADFKVQGERSYKISYTFAENNNPEQPEIIRLEKIWHNFRSDLSFYPLGISFWIHGDGTDNSLNVILLQQNDEFNLKNEQLETFIFTNDTILGTEGWQQVIIPYDKFLGASENPEINLNLSRVNGYRFEIVNLSGKAIESTIHIDALEQLTSYSVDISEPARFTSSFIQLHAPTHVDYDWSSLFDEYLEVGIDTLIVQRAALGSKEVDSARFFYDTQAIPWKYEGFNMIDQIFDAAESSGMKIILGLHGGRYPQDKGDASAYDKLYEKNVEIIDDLYEKFGENSSMAGWYICEEFHDGASNGWWNDNYRTLLAHYQQRVASYAKSKPNKYIVTIAPALWRGRPVDMTYHFFKTYFEQTPDIDILYLQDCGGRCAVDDGDFDVILPQWYEAVKQACDETGIQFGVDIETFKRCGSERIRWHGKSWENLKDQLFYANLFTKNITQFSWASFRPGRGAFEEYKKYLQEHGLLKSQQSRSENQP